MLTITRVKQATNEFIKVLRFGTADIVTANQSGSAGIDSKPIKNKIAIYAKTSNRNDAVIIGYINDSDKTEPGEIRIFSLDSNGAEKTFIHLKNDGTIEFAGTGDNLVRYTALNSGISNINAEFIKVAAVLNGLVPGSFVPTTSDISGAKINDFKTL